MRLAACFAVAFTILLCAACSQNGNIMDWMDLAMTGDAYDNSGKLAGMTVK